MLLKKQTVWLLTMLSLVIVLSVYYITSPTQQATDMAYQEKDAKEQAKGGDKETMSGNGMEVVTDAAGNEMFEALRLEVTDQRDQLREELEAKVANADVSAEEKSAAYEQMENLRELAMTESVLETMIKTMGYDDALVRANGENIRITVKSDKEHTKADANEIIRLVMSEVGQMKPVAVEFQPAN